MRVSQGIAWFLVFVYFGIGAGLIYLIYDQVGCSSSFYYKSDGSDSAPLDEYGQSINSSRNFLTKAGLDNSDSLIGKDLPKNYPLEKVIKPNKSNEDDDHITFTEGKTVYENPSSTPNTTSNTAKQRIQRSSLLTLGMTTKNTLIQKFEEGYYQEVSYPINYSVPVPLSSFTHRYCSNALHGMLCMAATLLIGLSIITYRLFLGYKTRVIKYAHMFLHLIALIIMCLGIWQAFVNEYSSSYTHFSAHNITSWVIFGLLILQITIASIIFIYIYPNTLLRLYISVYHDLFGAWLFICLVGCCLSGRRSINIDYTFINLVLFCTLTCVGFSIILLIVLSPYFEWELQGPL